MEDDAGWEELAPYVHLNPVRAASREGMVAKPEPAVIAERFYTAPVVV